MSYRYAYSYTVGRGGSVGQAPGTALAALLAGKVNSGMYDFRTATDPGLTGADNIAGGLGRIAAGTAAREPIISVTTGLLFDGTDDNIRVTAVTEAYTFDLLMRKTAGSTTGHIIEGLRLYTSGSATAVSGMTVDGAGVATRGALFTALDDGLWHHVRTTAATPPSTALGLGATSGSMAADVMLFSAINEVETTGTDLTAAREASAAWIEENRP